MYTRRSLNGRMPQHGEDKVLPKRRPLYYSITILYYETHINTQTRTVSEAIEEQINWKKQLLTYNQEYHREIKLMKRPRIILFDLARANMMKYIYSAQSCSIKAFFEIFSNIILMDITTKISLSYICVDKYMFYCFNLKN